MIVQSEVLDSMYNLHGDPPVDKSGHSHSHRMAWHSRHTSTVLKCIKFKMDNSRHGRESSPQPHSKFSNDDNRTIGADFIGGVTTAASS